MQMLRERSNDVFILSVESTVNEEVVVDCREIEENDHVRVGLIL